MNYSIVEIDNTFKIQIEDILEIQNVCFRCNTDFIKGTTKFGECGLDIF